MTKSRQFVWSLALFLLLCLCGGAGAAVAPGYDFVPGELIIKFNPQVQEKDKGDILAPIDGRKVKDFAFIGAEHWQIKSGSVESAVALLESDPRVEYVEPNYIVYALEIPDDTLFGDLWGMNNDGDFTDPSGNVAVADADIDAVEAWDVFTGSSSVLVAVIDTGIDYTHPDLVGNAWTNPGEIAGNGLDDDGNGFIDDIHGWDFANGDNDPMDDNDHGTHCSGTIGGVGNNALGVAGVNWDVSIMGCKFLTSGGSGSTADAISCIEYATMMGVDVMSNSWGGGPYDAAMEAAIEAAYLADIFFVAAAGNDGTDNDVTPHYPSNYPNGNVISVMATDCTDSPVNEPGWWSTCYGATTVDIAAPGLHIWSTTPGNTYQDFSGTSMATPHVSGAMAMLRGRFPGISVDDGKNLLMTIGNDPLASLSGLCVTGARLNLLKLIGDPDTIPPSDVTDLAAADVASNWVLLQWTAPGDDGTTGTASSYDVRYALTPILTGTDWDAATTVTGEPDPAVYGTTETMQVNGLDVLTTYYFGIRAKDEYGNLGGLSNSPAATTLGPPSIAVAPTSLSTTLETGGTDTQTLTISNVGDGVLDFSIPTAEYILPAKARFAAVSGFDYQPLAKGAAPADLPRIAAKGLGGPDAFGYNWRDSDEAGGPAYNWIEISALGTAVSLADDANSGPYPIGFPFSFYGTDYTEFRVCSNGWISFTDTGTDMSNGPLPSTGAPLAMLSLFWDDLDPSSGGNVYYYNDGARLIVEFTGVPHYDSGGVYTMQAHLYPNGAVEYHYQSMSAINDSGTIGIQNGDGTDGLTVVFNSAYVHDAMAVRFAAVTPWLSTSPGGGSVAAGASVDVDVVFSAAGLCGSHFDANLHVLSNDALNPEVVVAAGLDLIGTPDIAVDYAALDFGPVYVTAQADLELTIMNNGCADLTVSGVASDHGDFTTDAVTPLVLTAGSSAVVTVSFAPSTAGAIGGNLTIASDDADTPVLAVPLSGVGLDFPDIAVAPESLTETLPTGGTASQIVTITNNGLGDLNFTIPEPEYLSAAKRNVHVSSNSKPIELAKDAADPRVGAPVLFGAGGPDLFGYRWKDSDEPGGPSYNWIEINGLGTQVAMTDDDNEAGLPIGFTFPYYGNDFTTFNICSNGWISFTSTSTSLTNYELPSTSAPLDQLALFHDDLNPSSTGWIGYYNDGQRLIVEYQGVPRYSTLELYTMQVHLYPSGRIEYHYQTMQTGRLDEATIGIQNGDGTDGLTVAFNALYVHDAMAIRFQAQEPWLSATPVSGTVAPGTSLDVTVGFDASGLCGDQYLANLHVLSNDPDTPDAVVPVTLNLLGEPEAVLAPLSLDFGAVQLTQSAVLATGLVNNGCATLAVSELVIDNPVFTVDAVAPFNVAPGSGATLNVTFTPADTDTAWGVMTLTTNDPLEPVQTVTLLGVGLAIGEVSVTPVPMEERVQIGGTRTAVMTISNSGGGDLDFTIPSPVMYNKLVAELGDLTPPPFVEQPKDKADDSFGALPLGSGGPDAYGYQWMDSDETGGPVFAWVDISATGTVAMSTGDDSNLGPFPIGFTFNFYGADFTTFRVCSNGFLSFDSTLTAYTNQPLPYASGPTNLIAPFWDDLNLTNGGTVYYEVVGGDLVVMYDQVMPYGSSSGTGPFTFEVILAPSGKITLQYLTLVGSPASYTVGIQDGTRTVGLNIAYNTPYLHDNLAIEIRGALNWLSCSPSSGTVPAGGSVDVDVNFDAADMELGFHDGLLVVQTDDPLTPEVQVPVTMEVVDLSPVSTQDLPRATVLDQNAPNPFNPQTNIKFALPQAGHVELKVYDVRGALVQTLVSGRLEAGFHTSIWRGKDDQGKQAPSGVYFYRLEADGKLMTRRMTMIK